MLVSYGQRKAVQQECEQPFRGPNLVQATQGLGGGSLRIPGARIDAF